MEWKFKFILFILVKEDRKYLLKWFEFLFKKIYETMTKGKQALGKAEENWPDQPGDPQHECHRRSSDDSWGENHECESFEVNLLLSMKA